MNEKKKKESTLPRSKAKKRRSVDPMQSNTDPGGSYTGTPIPPWTPDSVPTQDVDDL